MVLKNDRAMQMLSLAQRAGKVASGEFMTETSVKEGKSFLVIIAQDAVNTAMQRKCSGSSGPPKKRSYSILRDV